MKSAIGAIDIGGTKIAAGAVSDSGEVLCRLECPTAPEDGFAAALERAKEMLREAGRRTCSIYSGVGVACPGPLDLSTGVIGGVGTLPGWQNSNIVAALGSEFGSVIVENDADAAALGEARCGGYEGINSLIYVTVSTGIGAGIIHAGRLYRGVGGAHPEIGHSLLDSSGPLCYCGARGCWESLGSGPAMSAWMHLQSPVKGERTAEQICDLARGGDKVALRAVEREGYYLGLGLANLITIFAPEVIVLGGGLMKSADLFLDNARLVIREVATQVPAEKTRIVLASLGPDAALAGAAMAWLQRSNDAELRRSDREND